MSRLETGPYRHTPDDWQGVFIRGDHALHYAALLRQAFDLVEAKVTIEAHPYREALERIAARDYPETAQAFASEALAANHEPNTDFIAEAVIRDLIGTLESCRE